MDNAKLKQLAQNPLLLTPNQFTPLTRTPWAGEEIGRMYKNEVLPDLGAPLIGESWEFSCDPDFPSKILEADITLQELVEQIPESILSSELARRSRGSIEILVKLINASQNLSLQVHPSDNDEYLAPNECGKPESWLILNAKKGAGIYLGFRKPIPKSNLAEILDDEEQCKKALQFVEVKEGDYFELKAGVPHAIGPGVVLLEPQRIVFGKSGKTYRLCDWGRRYDKDGRLDMKNGSPRQLHIKEGLRLIDPLTQVGEAFVNSVRKLPETRKIRGNIQVNSYPDNGYYSLVTIAMPQANNLKLNIENGYSAFIPLQGQVSLTGNSSTSITALKGQPVLIPNSAMPLKISSLNVAANFALVIPTGATLDIA